jgi:predicted enzyme related to lactoylglutathione lyase
MINPVVWFEIYVDDMERAQKFYETVLAKKLEKMDMPEGSGDMAMMSFPSDMESYGAGGALVKMEGMKAGGNSTLVYFPCEDCAVEEGRVEAAGGHVVKPKSSIGEYGHMSLCTDSEGNMFGLHTK